MIKEDYVSFEVAKLLKEKGFNEQCRDFYRKENEECLHRNTYEYNYFNLQMPRWEDCYSCPTHQMAMAWLREVHNLFIEPTVGETNGKTWYDFDIIPINGREIAWDHYNNLPFVECNSYEEAVEAALKYCLENLI